MATIIGIYGLGRATKEFIRQWCLHHEDTYSDFNLTIISDPTHTIEEAYEYILADSVDGDLRVNSKITFELDFDDNSFIINGKRIKYYQNEDPGYIPFGQYSVDILLNGTDNVHYDDYDFMGTGIKKFININNRVPNDGKKVLVYGVNSSALSDSDVAFVCPYGETCALASILHAIEETSGAYIESYCNTVILSPSYSLSAEDSYNNIASMNSLMRWNNDINNIGRLIGPIIPSLNTRLASDVYKSSVDNVSFVNINIPFSGSIPFTKVQLKQTIKNLSEDSTLLTASAMELATFVSTQAKYLPYVLYNENAAIFNNDLLSISIMCNPSKLIVNNIMSILKEHDYWGR